MEGGRQGLMERQHCDSSGPAKDIERAHRDLEVIHTHHPRRAVKYIPKNPEKNKRKLKLTKLHNAASVNCIPKQYFVFLSSSARGENFKDTDASKMRQYHCSLLGVFRP